ncbi:MULTISPECIES: hypothetical protein [Streptacidiphilus]|uniref:N-acetyltransferase domain-containing protein n=1 Tax=Streptacidiphilus cavernicola TaxID=3342716 RepID=A0ABV6UFZ3_9ACTN|nr:hypothetical protein [Streptacidiphilus jeojiense]
MTEPLPLGFTDISTAALKEIMVRTPWRGTGTALRIHDTLLSNRTEERVTLSVNPLAGDGKVQALYVTWGYEPFNEQRPSPDSPSLIAMIRSLKCSPLLLTRTETASCNQTDPHQPPLSDHDLSKSHSFERICD